MKRFFIVLICLVLFLPAAFGIFITVNSLPVSADSVSREFVINSGDSLSVISRRLAQNGLVKNPYVFMVHSYLMGLNSRLQAGSFDLSPSMSTREVISRLSRGGSLDYWLTIKGGQRLEEVAQFFDDPSQTITSRQFLEASQGKEGYLYPDSYKIPRQYSVDRVLEVIQSNFQSKYEQIAAKSQPSSLNQSEVIILASIIEREARQLESKQMVAGILFNRLEINMPLQVDAAAQYARDSRSPRPKSYWNPATSTDLKIDSPYNTYLYPGLPPAPICSPGQDSIFAALNPTPSDYLFYITGSDNRMYYAQTLSEHNSNIQKYLR